MGYKNPLLKLPAAQRLMARPRRDREDLAALFQELRHEADRLAQESWKRSKAPMAAYWKATAVYSRHCAHALTRGADTWSQADNGLSCRDCGAAFQGGDELLPVRDPGSRLRPGDPMPHGDCPSCGGQVHPVADALLPSPPKEKV